MVMKKISLIGKNGVGEFALVDDEDYTRVSKLRWCVNNYGYAIRCIYLGKGKSQMIWMHRFVMGELDRKLEIEHKNNKKLDNRKINLRICSRRQNMMNRGLSKHNTSGFKGIVKSRDRWRAIMNFDGRKVHIGCFSTKEEAAKAYNKKAKELYGEFAWLNPI